MQRRVFLFLALVLCVPAMALANSLTAPVGVVLTGGPGQVITIGISGNDFYTDSNFAGTIDAGGPLVTAIFGKAAPSGAIPVGNLAGSVWAGSGFSGTADYGLTPAAGFFAPSGAQNTAGTYVTLTIDSTGVVAGTYNLDMSATSLFNGLDENGDPVVVNLSFVGGSFIMPGVPEPSSVVLGLFAVAGLAAVAIRRRRTA